jgi:hypothetical protein
MGARQLHQTKPDVIIVQSGEAALVCGGQVIDPQPTAPCEIEGSEIKGGTSLTIKTGDVIHIPHPAYPTSFSSLQGKRPIKIAEDRRSEHVSNMCLTCLMFRIE